MSFLLVASVPTIVLIRHNRPRPPPQPLHHKKKHRSQMQL